MTTERDRKIIKRVKEELNLFHDDFMSLEYYNPDQAPLRDIMELLQTTPLNKKILVRIHQEDCYWEVFTEEQEDWDQHQLNAFAYTFSPPYQDVTIDVLD